MDSGLAADIVAVAELSGDFTLRSGRVADHYFDKYRFEARPDLLRRVADDMVPLVPDETEVLAGLELGGVPVATALSFATELPVCFVRKEAKIYGTRRLAEGAEVEGRRALIVEDVITSGGQVVASAEELRVRGAAVTDALCVIDREAGGRAALANAGMRTSALFTESDLRARAIRSPRT